MWASRPRCSEAKASGVAVLSFMSKSFLYPGGREASGDTSYNRLPADVPYVIGDGTQPPQGRYTAIDGVILRTDTTQERLTEREEENEG